MTPLARVLIPIFALACLTPYVSSAVALALGVAIALTIGNPYAARMRGWTHHLLSLAVIGLGAGMDLNAVGRAGAHGLGYTALGITVTLALGTWLGRRLGVGANASLLINVGTAICGGSAIAAVAPVVRARDEEISVALGCVFTLNAVALGLFPWLGHALGLTEEQFGTWAALSIHDTSSVVGATMRYGARALEVGTTVKLARALWIIPLAAAFAIHRRRATLGAAATKPRRPWFILGFLIAAGLVTRFPDLRDAGHQVEAAAKRVTVLTLFFIGATLTRETLRAVGAKPFAQALLLWVITAAATLAAVRAGVVG